MTCGLSRPLSSVWMWNVWFLYLTLLLKPTCARRNAGRAISRSARVSSSTDQRDDRALERRVIARDAFHALEGQLGELRGGIDPQRLGEQVLALGVVGAARGPRGEDRHGIVGPALAEQPLGHA